MKDNGRIESLLRFHFSYDMLYFIDYIPGYQDLSGIIDAMSKDRIFLSRSVEAVLEEIALSAPVSIKTSLASVIIKYDDLLSMLERENKVRHGEKPPEDQNFEYFSPALFYRTQSEFHSALTRVIVWMKTKEVV